MIRNDVTWQMVLLSLLGFKLVWGLCVLFANTLLGVVIGLIALHCYWLNLTMSSLRLYLLFAAFGFCLDWLLSVLGVFVFPTEAKHFPANTSTMPPIWLFVLWFGFVTTLSSGLKFLSGQYKLCVALGALGGTLSYYSAVKLEAVTFGIPTSLASLIIALLWALIMPAFVWLNDNQTQTTMTTLEDRKC
ncbi:hypothetical protein C2869_12720 [Saccharobesus litoralis]|uniref:DUF2878 domain-containing protein n=1 Tax=Saccharobesus litoralis TaxID=2172099 RepID=A0A2S0VSR3_9ALTE|nr:hypothetical protein C2869_12720 [Saccharobesus litoralis]